MKKIPWLITIIAIITTIFVVYGAQSGRFFVNTKFSSNSQENSQEDSSLFVEAIHQTDNFYDIQVEYPQFNNTGENFNKKISDLITEKIETFKKESKDNYEARRTTAPTEEPLPENPLSPFDFICEWEPVQINDDYLSFVIRIYYFVGGAHGANEIYAFNYDLKNKKEITIIDFVNSSQQLFEKIAELSKENITSQLEGNGTVVDDFLKQMVEEGTKATQNNYKNFNFNYNSLIIYFQQYQVAPGVQGPMIVTLYKNTLDTNSIKSNYIK